MKNKHGRQNHKLKLTTQLEYLFTSGIIPGYVLPDPGLIVGGSPKRKIMILERKSKDYQATRLKAMPLLKLGKKTA